MNHLMLGRISFDTWTLDGQGDYRCLLPENSLWLKAAHNVYFHFIRGQLFFNYEIEIDLLAGKTSPF